MRYLSKFFLPAALVGALFLLSACDDDETIFVNVPGPATGVVAGGITVTIIEGQTIELLATGTTAGGTVFADQTAPYDWASSNNLVAVVDETADDGKVTGLTEGTAFVQASYINDPSRGAVAQITVLGIEKITVTATPATVVDNARSVLTAEGTLSDGTTADVTQFCTFSASSATAVALNPAVATDGTVFTVGQGAVAGTADFTCDYTDGLGNKVSDTAANLVKGTVTVEPTLSTAVKSALTLVDNASAFVTAEAIGDTTGVVYDITADVLAADWTVTDGAQITVPDADGEIVGKDLVGSDTLEITSGGKTSPPITITLEATTSTVVKSAITLIDNASGVVSAEAIGASGTFIITANVVGGDWTLVNGDDIEGVPDATGEIVGKTGGSGSDTLTITSGGKTSPAIVVTLETTTAASVTVASATEIADGAFVDLVVTAAGAVAGTLDITDNLQGATDWTLAGGADNIVAVPTAGGGRIVGVSGGLAAPDTLVAASGGVSSTAIDITFADIDTVSLSLFVAPVVP